MLKSHRSSGFWRRRWLLGDDVVVACSGTTDGDMKDPTRRTTFLMRCGCRGALRICHQVHGAEIQFASPALKPAVQGDGVIATEDCWAPGVFGADCPGLVIASPDCLAIAHCGWRGIAAGIVERLIEGCQRASRHPCRDWTAFIGPGICANCYEVGDDVLAAAEWPRGSVRPTLDDTACLDLSRAIRAKMEAAGVGCIHRSRSCTREHDDLFSYRRTGSKAAHLLVAWREPRRAGPPSSRRSRREPSTGRPADR